MVNEKQNKLIMDEIKAKISEASKMAQDGLEDRYSEVDSAELVGITDLIVENKVLIDRVDDMLGQPLTSSAS